MSGTATASLRLARTPHESAPSERDWGTYLERFASNVNLKMRCDYDLGPMPAGREEILKSAILPFLFVLKQELCGISRALQEV